MIHARENTCGNVTKSVEAVEESATTEDRINIISDEKCIDISPSSGYSSSMTDNQEGDEDDLRTVMQRGVLLIDLNSPRCDNASAWNDITIVDTDSDNHKWEMFEEEAD